jgi:hypothetical protein
MTAALGEAWGGGEMVVGWWWDGGGASTLKQLRNTNCEAPNKLFPVVWPRSQELFTRFATKSAADQEIKHEGPTWGHCKTKDLTFWPLQL